MKPEITAEIIGSSVTLIGILGSTYLSYKSFKQSKKLSKEAKVSLAVNNLKEKKDYVTRKLNEFYYPLRNYLNTSKSFSEILKNGKPTEFRTLLHLLNPDIEYNGKRLVLTDNDNAILKQIFKIGFEIEKLISIKSEIIDDPEFIGKYVPSKEFSDIRINDDMSILTLTQNHLRIIRLAYAGGLKHEEQKYKSYVYPRELNFLVDNKIEKLEAEIKDYETKISKLIA